MEEENPAVEQDGEEEFDWEDAFAPHDGEEAAWEDGGEEADPDFDWDGMPEPDVDPAELQEALLASFRTARGERTDALSYEEMNACILATGIRTSLARAGLEEGARILMEAERQEILRIEAQRRARDAAQQEEEDEAVAVAAWMRRGRGREPMSMDRLRRRTATAARHRRMAEARAQARAAKMAKGANDDEAGPSGTGKE